MTETPAHRPTILENPTRNDLRAILKTVRPCDYFTVQTHGVVAEGIRWFERHNINPEDREGAWANHAGVFGEGTIYQASPPSLSRKLKYETHGFQEGDLLEYAGCRIAISSRPLTDHQRDLGLGSIEAMVGIPYNLLDIGALGFSTVGAVPEPVWDRLNRGDRLICSQAVAKVQRDMNDPITVGQDCRVTPAHLSCEAVLTGHAHTSVVA